MNFQNYLKISAAEIDRELDTFFDKWSKEVWLISPKLADLIKSFILANAGGKRLRGSLVKLGYEMAFGKANKEILKSAMAYELFQTAILAHDDIVDLSPLRRGKPTIYKALGGDHYGISQTICIGDTGFFLAYKIIAESNYPEKLKNLAIASFSRSMLDTGLGEMLDIELPHQNQETTQTDVLTIFRLKTAMYTIIGPLSLGAILGGADKKMLESITEFGKSLGIAFQIQDDILGIFGDEKVLGKSVTSDIEEGKITLMILFANKHGSTSQQKFLEKNYGKGKIGMKEVDEIRDIFIKTGALAYSQQEAETLVSEAKKIIPQLTKNQKLRAILEEMADFLVQRQK